MRQLHDATSQLSNAMTATQLIACLDKARINRANFRATNLENCSGYNPYESEIEQLSEQLSALTAAGKKAILSGESLSAERAWFNSQGFGGRDLAAANTACLARGYSLADLQAAAKAAVAA